MSVKKYISRISFLVMSLLFVSFVAAPDVLAAGYTWTKQASAGFHPWQNVTSSSNGKYLAADTDGGDIYTSSDYGTSWTDQTAAGSRSWTAITSTADGSHVAAEVWGGDIYTSTDYGVTWTDQTAAGAHNWSGIAYASDGSHLVGTVNNGYIYVSADYGATWTTLTAAGSRGWNWITASSTGQYLAAVNYSGDVYTSSDYGTSWTDQAGSGARNWAEITSSSNGKYLVAVPFTGDIYTSNDYGATWTAQTAAGSRAWYGLASSSNGQYIYVPDDTPGYIYVSSDYGATWTAQTSTGTGSWSAIAASADGTRLVATTYGSTAGYIWTGYNGDQDNDGISTAVEDAAPNSGDANNDGIQDSSQAYVASFGDTVSGKYATVAVANDCTLSTVSDSAESSEATQDSGYSYPAGLLNFSESCGTQGFTSTITQYYYGVTGSNLVLRKYDASTKKYVTVSGATITQTTIGGQSVTKVTYSVTDGGSLDEDGTANGVIVDPAGLAAPVATLTNTGTNTLLADLVAGTLVVAALSVRYVSRHAASQPQSRD